MFYYTYISRIQRPLRPASVWSMWWSFQLTETVSSVSGLTLTDTVGLCLLIDILASNVMSLLQSAFYPCPYTCHLVQSPYVPTKGVLSIFSFFVASRFIRLCVGFVVIRHYEPKNLFAIAIIKYNLLPSPHKEPKKSRIPVRLGNSQNNRS